MSDSNERDLCFVSYSHEDKEWLDRLMTMLAPLLKAKKLKLWTDKEIRAGKKWRDEIENALSRTKIAVFLVSQNFLASDFINDEEMPPLLAAAEKDGAQIFWIAVGTSLVNHTPLGKYQAA
ncbi:MAG TPA: toll/interleukin-1 receptor domain-containing protein, partial [Blastocatellia bacterium]|nr:toll/interleukin-1 receptor domain-containing protein [Blastocatellia bacterium]